MMQETANRKVSPRKSRQLSESAIIRVLIERVCKGQTRKLIADLQLNIAVKSVETCLTPFKTNKINKIFHAG